MRNYLQTLTAVAFIAAAGTTWATDDSLTSSGSTLSPAEEKQAAKCQENLAKIDGAKEQFALEYKKSNNTTVTWEMLLDPAGKGRLGEGYLKKQPVCPAGGKYSLNPIGKDPTCSLGEAKQHKLQ